MRQNRQNIQASILDRLIDYEPNVSYEPVQRRVMNYDEGKASVIRDLENLLNTKSYILTIPPEYKEVNNSLLVYGVKDFTSQNPKSISVRYNLRKKLESAIARFEPRLKDVKIKVEGTTDNERSLKFRINGLLVLDPIVRPVTFDTLFSINNGDYTIQR